MQKKKLNFRLILVCLVAASVALPIALVSIGKALLLAGGAACLFLPDRAGEPNTQQRQVRLSSFAVVGILCIFALSIFWTRAPLAEALGSLAKYGKLLIIPLIAFIIRSRKEALYALGVFGFAQAFLLLSSWMLFLHMPVPWATSPLAHILNAPFSSYLDEGIMSAVFASICWHLRPFIADRSARYGAIVLAGLALMNVFFVLDGRTGHVVAIVLISLAIMWELPRRIRASVLLLPFVLLLILTFMSPRVQHRLAEVKSEVQSFSVTKGESMVPGSSSGIRLHLWRRAVQSMAESPVLGSGIGSWTSEFNRLETQRASVPQQAAPLGNPHQEYLHWGVQLGIPGLLLLLALITAFWRDTLTMETPVAHAARSLIAALAVACLFNSSLYDALIGDFFCVALGLLLALGIHRPVAVAGRNPQPGS